MIPPCACDAPVGDAWTGKRRSLSRLTLRVLSCYVAAPYRASVASRGGGKERGTPLVSSPPRVRRRLARLLHGSRRAAPAAALFGRGDGGDSGGGGRGGGGGGGTARQWHPTNTHAAEQQQRQQRGGGQQRGREADTTPTTRRSGRSDAKQQHRRQSGAGGQDAKGLYRDAAHGGGGGNFAALSNVTSAAAAAGLSPGALALVASNGGFITAATAVGFGLGLWGCEVITCGMGLGPPGVKRPKRRPSAGVTPLKPLITASLKFDDDPISKACVCFPATVAFRTSCAGDSRVPRDWS